MNFLGNVLLAAAVFWPHASGQAGDPFDTSGHWILDVHLKIWRALQGELVKGIGPSTMESGWAVVVEAQRGSDYRWKLLLRKRGVGKVDAAYVHIPTGLYEELKRIVKEHGQISWEEAARQVRFSRATLTADSCPALLEVTDRFETLAIPALSERQPVFHPGPTYTVRVLGPSHIPTEYEVYQGRHVLSNWCEVALDVVLSCTPAN